MTSKYFHAPLMAAVMLSHAYAQPSAAVNPGRDEFGWLNEFNKASAAMLVEQGIVSRQLGRVIANAIVKVDEDARRPGAARPGIGAYLALEKQLTDAGGPDVSQLHSGRSRQDLLATYNRVVLRDRTLSLLAANHQARRRLQKMAGENIETVIPAYTNGVQAQPITFGHYLLAFDAALARDGTRLREAYPRVNRSPFGAAALGTSSFPVARSRLADLLGFDGPEENSYDANLVSSMDVPLEVVHHAASSALTVGALIEDIVAQYRGTEPWLLVREGTLTGPSSIMPQKRNPYGLNDVRRAATLVLADAAAFSTLAHNVSPGMLDYKTGSAEAAIDRASDMFAKFSALMDALVVNKARALEEVNSDYSTTTELADILQRDSGVPFRIGHHFASELVTYGRAHRLKPSELPYDEAKRIYAESARAMGFGVSALPLSEEKFRKTLTAEGMVQSSRGLGGPQRAEVARMLAEHQSGLASEENWLRQSRSRLAATESKLDEAFSRLR
jgi:argininosuccinate lyase